MDARVNTETTISETIMPQITESEEQHEPDDHTQQAYERCDEQRATLRLCMGEIASEATLALQEADLNMQMYYSIPSSGAALLTFMTPAHPSDEAWELVTETICSAVSSKIKVSGLIGRPLTCAASGAQVNVAEVSGEED
jgi:hypothetical protein